jgi:nicotinamide mononucleotide transporter
LKHFFDIHHEFFRVIGYSMSYIEFLGVLTGLVSVWLSAKANIWNWPAGLFNILLSFSLYYQVRLYPDMLLQIFFFISNILGCWRWANPHDQEQDNRAELRISSLNTRQLVWSIGLSLTGILVLGNFASKLNRLFPSVFSMPSAYPYIDSGITIGSILATYLLIQKKMETWLVWVIIDIVATVLYFVKGVKFYSAEYFVFTCLAAYGLLHWKREYRNYSLSTI